MTDGILSSSGEDKSVETTGGEDKSIERPDGGEAGKVKPDSQVEMEKSAAENKKDENPQTPDDYKRNWEKADKQIKDLRRIISKGKAPEDVSEYKNFKPDSKFERYYEEGSEDYKKIEKVVNGLDDLSMKLGLNVEGNAQLKSFFNENFLDSRTKEQIKEEAEKAKQEQLNLLGEDAEDIIADAVYFIDNNSLFSKEEREFIKSNFDSALGVSIVQKMQKAVNPGRKSIPTAPVLAGGYDAEALSKEYKNKDTTVQRRLEILETMKKNNLGSIQS